MLRVEIAMEMNKAVGGKWEEGITLFHPLCSVHLWICGYAHGGQITFQILFII